ncbi:MAG: RNA polymerase sporulation sigma factor SigK [bacterium]|nr:RNA polymerase sporulation sigma factor SigK [bacterium]
MQLFDLFCELFFLAGYVRNGSSFPEPLPQEEEQACLKALAGGSEEAREKLIAHNLRLVAHIAKKYARAGRDIDDLISIGAVGLIKAVSTFDASKGSALSAYASRCVENEILMSLRAERKQVSEVSLSDAVGVDNDGNDVTLMDILGGNPDTVMDEVQARLDTERIRKTMREVLTEREYVVVRLRFGLFGAYRMAQREVATLLGISRSYVSRIEKRALSKLRTALSAQ